MAEEETKTEEVVEEAAVEKEAPISEIVYGRGLPTVIMPFMGPFDDMFESVKYRAQLVARDQKLGSGVNAAMPVGFTIGFLFALLMVLVPVLLTT
jgi:tetrahydromethanopterin S-methyltransferase subunit F